MMFECIITNIRRKYHPLFHIQRNSLYRKISRFINIPLCCKVRGIKWKIYLRFPTDLSFFFGPRVFETTLSSLFLAVNDVFKPKTFWDLGANIGFYSWLLKSNNNDIQIVMVEPDPNNICLLQKTINSAKLINTYIIEAAVSAKKGTEIFLIDDISGKTGGIVSSKNIFFQHLYSLSKKITVKTISIDDMVEIYPPPDLIKVDVEGSENLLFEGAVKTIKSHQPIIISECIGSGVDDVIKKMRDLNYRLFSADEINGSIEKAINILFLPQHNVSMAEALFNSWQQKLKEWQR